MDLEDKIMGRIEREGIRRMPRWFFRAKDLVLLIAALASVAIAGILGGVSIISIGRSTHEISALDYPYIPMMLAAAMLFVAYRSLVRSFSFYKIRTSILLVSLTVAAFCFSYGAYLHLFEILWKI